MGGVRGEVLSYDDQAGFGLISGDDGTRYSFPRSELQQLTPVRPGMRVDFVAQGTVATGVVILAAASTYEVRPDTDRTRAWGYFRRCIAKYADGTGRARRKEYWYFVLFHLLILAGPLVLVVVFAGIEEQSASDEMALLTGIAALVLVLIYLFFLLPGLAALIRRFHDVGLSGWLVLLGLIPYVGGFITFIITLLPSEARTNKHGPVPGQAPRSTADVFS